jgi:hypothetical protein
MLPKTIQISKNISYYKAFYEARALGLFDAFFSSMALCLKASYIFINIDSFGDKKLARRSPNIFSCKNYTLFLICISVKQDTVYFYGLK